jgi:Ca2+-transporting ATPase
MLNMRGRGSRFFQNDVFRSPWIWYAVGLCTILLILAVYLPRLSSVLKTSAPGLEGWTVAIGISLLPLVTGQAWIMIRRKGS